MARITGTKRRLRVRSGKLVSANQLIHLSLRPTRLPAKVAGQVTALLRLAGAALQDQGVAEAGRDYDLNGPSGPR